MLTNNNKKKGNRNCERFLNWKCELGKSEFFRGASNDKKAKTLPWGPSTFREQ